MAWTILWAILGVLCQGLVSWLGWTMNHETISANKRKLAHIGFIGMTVVGMFSIAMVTYRSGRMERAHFKMSYSQVYGNSLAPTWSNAPGIFPIGKPLDFNVTFQDVGGTATGVAHQGMLTLEPDMSMKSMRGAVDKFRKLLKADPLGPSEMTLVKGEQRFTTFAGDALSPTDFNNLAHGRRVVYIVGLFKFADDFGQHTHKICEIIEPPQISGTIILNSCSAWVGEK